jgi:hypothetical protein
VQDEGELGLAGATVQLRSSTGVSRSMTTDEAGNYLFTNLAAGTYVVELLATPTELLTLTTASDFTVTLAAGDNSLTADFGLYPLDETGSGQTPRPKLPVTGTPLVHRYVSLGGSFLAAGLLLVAAARLRRRHPNRT